MSGEHLHERGREGATRAKEWLEATTRVDAPWVNPERFAVPKLTFKWADETSTFSYDLGGTLRGGDFNGQMFLAEVKYYSGVSDQPEMYVEYLAKCYRAFASRPERCDNFMWITWHPFSQGRWGKLTSAEEVEIAVLKHHARVLGTKDEAEALDALDRQACKSVADKLWLILLSERQELLVISREHRGLIRAHDIAKGGS